MALTTLEEYVALRASGEFLNQSKQNICAMCNQPITGIEDKMEPQFCDGKRVHSDCYFSALGALVEQHPILSPRVRHPGRPD